MKRLQKLIKGRPAYTSMKRFLYVPRITLSIKTSSPTYYRHRGKRDYCHQKDYYCGNTKNGSGEEPAKPSQAKPSQLSQKYATIKTHNGQQRGLAGSSDRTDPKTRFASNTGHTCNRDQGLNQPTKSTTTTTHKI